MALRDCCDAIMPCVIRQLRVINEPPVRSLPLLSHLLTVLHGF